MAPHPSVDNVRTQAKRAIAARYKAGSIAIRVRSVCRRAGAVAKLPPTFPKSAGERPRYVHEDVALADNRPGSRWFIFPVSLPRFPQCHPLRHCPPLAKVIWRLVTTLRQRVVDQFETWRNLLDAQVGFVRRTDRCLFGRRLGA